jgi:class I fructose-bisphosphate aldolase
MEILKTGKLEELLGANAAHLLEHTCKTIDKKQLHLPGPISWTGCSHRATEIPRCSRNLQALYGNGRLARTGLYEHPAGGSGHRAQRRRQLRTEPVYFDSEKIVELALEGGCNAVASTFGVLASVSRKYAHKIPFIVKINHNELMTLPNKFDQVLFGTVESAWEMGAAAIGATIYFGSEESARQITEIAEAFRHAH